MRKGNKKIESEKSKIESERQNTLTAKKEEFVGVAVGCCPSLEDRGWGE
jgi:hypothetical protein